MVQGRKAGSLMLRDSGSTLHGSAPQYDDPTITRTVLREQGTSSDLPKLILVNWEQGAYREAKFLVSRLPIDYQPSQKRGRNEVARI